MKRKSVIRFLLTLGTFLPIITAPLLRAHCDGMDGPVVKAAQKAPGNRRGPSRFDLGT